MFSRFERTKTETIIKITKTTGINVITERCCDIRKKYTARKINDLMNTVILNTAIIERECFKRRKYFRIASSCINFKKE